MHLLRGEVLAYNMVNIAADAIFTLERDLKNATIAANLSARMDILHCYFLLFSKANNHIVSQSFVVAAALIVIVVE